ncbi:MAG: hypothetical protein HUK21_03370 [Fibrobacteraceae bacterium]|nr:hypothetical protein [Fibrobacteraceae bacterium]
MRRATTPIVQFLFIFTVVFCGIVLSSCLEIPSDPNTSKKVKSIQLYIIQDEKKDSTTLKINPNAQAELSVQVKPSKYEGNLKYTWYHNEIELESNQSYTLKAHCKSDSIPNRLVVKDKENNQDTLDFNIIVNSKPYFYQPAKPASGDTLYGNVSTTFTFAWYTSDDDIADQETLTHIIKIDDTQYNVSSLTTIAQSGFNPGEHSFTVYVKDSFNEWDSLPSQHFFVVDTLEAP